MSLMERDQVEKMKRNWLVNMDFDIAAVQGAGPYEQELRQFERDTRYAQWEAEFLARRDAMIKTHAPELVHYQSGEWIMEKVTRVRTPGGWLYSTAIIARGFPTAEKFDPKKPHGLEVALTTVFVAEVPEQFTSPQVHVDRLIASHAEGWKGIVSLIHSSRDLVHFRSKFDLTGLDASDLATFIESIDAVWEKYWGFTYAAKKNGSQTGKA